MNFDRLIWNALLMLFLPVLLTGCAVQTFDEETGTVHLWGFGHLALSTQKPLTKDSLQAVSVTTDTLGVRLDHTHFNSGLGLGYQGTQVTYVVKDNAALKVGRVGWRGLRLLPLPGQQPDEDSQPQSTPETP